MKNKNIYYLQPKKILHISLIDSVELDELVFGMGPFIDRITKLFLRIFKYLFKGKPVFSVREYAFGSYFSISFPRAKKSPLLRLLTDMDGYKGVEILIKKDPDNKISDTDFESIIMGTKDIEDTLFIVVNNKDIIHDHEADRLNRSFINNLVTILPIALEEIYKLEKWVSGKNINACLLFFYTLTDEIMSRYENDKPRARMVMKYQKNFIERAYDQVGELNGQLHTVIMKLRFLTSYMPCMGKIEEVCEITHICPKTYYNWLKKDPGFRNIIKI